MTIQHNIIADPDIHEPKGVATAASNSLYVANGSGSGVWQTVDTSSLANGAVETAKIEDLNVTGAKIANQTIVTTKFSGLTTSGTAGQLLKAVGDGSLVYSTHNPYAGGYLAFSTVSPYTFATTTSDQILNPTLIAGDLNSFTLLSSPNMRFRYDGTETIDCHVTCAMSSSQASGAGKDCQWALFKNGVELVGSRGIRSLSSGDYGSITLLANTTLSTNDYLEVHTQASGACTVNYAALSMILLGVAG